MINAVVQARLAARGIPFEPPYGCAWCGEEQHHHGRQWAPIVGMHSWMRPSQPMILERMRYRRSQRLTAVPARYHATTAWAASSDGESGEPYCADCKTDGCHRWARIQVRLDQQRYGLPRRTRRRRKNGSGSDGTGSWGGQSWPF